MFALVSGKKASIVDYQWGICQCSFGVGEGLLNIVNHYSFDLVTVIGEGEGVSVPLSSSIWH